VKRGLKPKRWKHERERGDEGTVIFQQGENRTHSGLKLLAGDDRTATPAAEKNKRRKHFWGRFNEVGNCGYHGGRSGEHLNEEDVAVSKGARVLVEKLKESLEEITTLAKNKKENNRKRGNYRGTDRPKYWKKENKKPGKENKSSSQP